MQTRHGGACGGEGGESHRHHHYKIKRMMMMSAVLESHWQVEACRPTCCCKGGHDQHHQDRVLGVGKHQCNVFYTGGTLTLLVAGGMDLVSGPWELEGS